MLKWPTEAVFQLCIFPCAFLCARTNKQGLVDLAIVTDGLDGPGTWGIYSLGNVHGHAYRSIEDLT